MDLGCGGGIYCDSDASPRLVNCTFYNNSAGKRGGAVYSHQGSPELVNCILWENSPDEIALTNQGLVVTYSNVQGKLTTYVTGLPDISADMVLHIPLAGQMVITEHAADNPDEVVGQITCDVMAIFVADMNAERAVVNEAEGTITAAFGASVEEGPDGLMTVTEATGSLADIKQVSPWEWHVNGTMQIVRVPGLPLQQNILAALQNADLLLGAEEEFALTGSYYRSPPQE